MTTAMLIFFILQFNLTLMVYVPSPLFTIEVIVSPTPAIFIVDVDPIGKRLDTTMLYELFDVCVIDIMLIGDKETDIQAGFTAGLKSILVSENCQSNKRTLIETNCICLCDIEAAKRYILSSI